jgi:hypothetical protein
MRYVLALGLLIALCVSASAAKVHRAKPRDVIVAPSQSLTPALTDQERKRLHDINIPSYNDPSKFGGG